MKSTYKIIILMLCMFFANIVLISAVGDNNVFGKPIICSGRNYSICDTFDSPSLNASNFRRGADINDPVMGGGMATCGIASNNWCMSTANATYDRDIQMCTMYKTNQSGANFNLMYGTTVAQAFGGTYEIVPSYNDNPAAQYAFWWGNTATQVLTKNNFASPNNVTVLWCQLGSGFGNMTIWWNDLLNNSNTVATTTNSANPYFMNMHTYAGSKTSYHYYITWNGTLGNAPFWSDSTVTPISNSSFNVTNYQDLLSNSTGWNYANGNITVSRNLLTATFSTNTNTNASCSIHNLNYTQMVAKNSNYKLATTETMSHSFTLFDNLTNGNTTTCVYCAYYDGSQSASSGCLRTIYTDTIAPLQNRTSQQPPDLTTTNIITQHLRANFNITDESGVSDAKLYYKTNYSDSNFGVCILGICSGSYKALSYSTLVGSNYTFILDDNDILPASYNIDEAYAESIAHQVNTIASSNDAVKITLKNLSSSHYFGIYEVMANSTTGNLNAYYCNFSYTTGNYKTSPNCANFGTILQNAKWNHTHTINSSHATIPFILSNGQIGGVGVSPTGYFIINPTSSGEYDSLNNNTGTVQTTANNGNAWTNQTYTVDSHIHQFDSLTRLLYFTTANDTNGNRGNSTLYTDVFDIAVFPPSAPVVQLPSGVYSNFTQFQYTNSSVSNPSFMKLAYYLIEMFDSQLNYHMFVYNNSLNLTYSFNNSPAMDGKYYGRVTAFDNFTEYNSGFSSLYYIDRTSPRCSNFAVSTTAIGSNSTVSAEFTDLTLNSVLFFANTTIDYNETYNASFIDDYNASSTWIVENGTILVGYIATDYAGQSTICSRNVTGTEPPSSNVVFTIGGCPDTLVSVLIICICVLIALFFIALGYIMQNLYLPIFGWIFLIIVSWYLIGCIGLYASIMMIVSILMILLTVVMIKNKDFG